MYQQVKNILFNPEYKHSIPLAFLAVLGCVLLFNFHIIYNFYPQHAFPGAETFIQAFNHKFGNASGYWSVAADEYVNLLNGNFADINKHTFVSYLFPFSLLVVKKSAAILHIDAVILFQIILATLFAVFIGIVLPKTYQVISGNKANLLQILYLFVLTWLFWRGWFYVPLPDFPAVFCLFAGVYFFSSYYRNSKWALLFLSGLFFALAVLLRGNYIYSVYIVLISLAIYKESEFSIKNITLANAPLALGRMFIFILPLLMVGAPEAHINKIKYGKTSYVPYLPSVSYLNKDKNNHPLNWNNLEGNGSLVSGSFIMQKSYPGPYYDRHAVSLRMHDINTKYNMSYGTPTADGAKTTKDIFEHWPILSDIEYWDLLISNPVDTLAIFTRHFCIGLDQKTPNLYLQEFNGKYYAYTSGPLLSILNYTLLFAALMLFYANRKKVLANRLQLSMLAVILLPSLITIPGSMQNQYLLSIHMLIYCLFSFYLLGIINNWKKLYVLIKKYILQWTIVVSCLFMLSSAILGHL